MDRESTGHDTTPSATTPSALPAHRRSARNAGARAVLVILGVSAVLLALTWLLGGLG